MEKIVILKSSNVKELEAAYSDWMKKKGKDVDKIETILTIFNDLDRE